MFMFVELSELGSCSDVQLVAKPYRKFPSERTIPIPAVSVVSTRRRMEGITAGTACLVYRTSFKFRRVGCLCLSDCLSSVVAG